MWRQEIRSCRASKRRNLAWLLRSTGLLCVLAMTACFTPPVVSKDISIELKPRFWNATVIEVGSKSFRRKYPYATYIGFIELKAQVNTINSWLIDPISDSDLGDAGSDYGADVVSRGYQSDRNEMVTGYFGRPGAVYTRRVMRKFLEVRAYLYSTNRNLHLVANLSSHSKPKLMKILAGIRSGKLRRLSLPMKSGNARALLFARAIRAAYLTGCHDFERTRIIAEIQYAWTGVDNRKDIRGQMAYYQKEAADIAAAKAKKEAREKEKYKRKKAKELFEKQKWLALVITEGFDYRLKLPPKWESLADHKLAALAEGRQVSRYVRMGEPTKFTKPQIWLEAVAVNAAPKVQARALFKDPKRSCNHRDPFQIDKRPDGTTLLSVAHRSALPGGRTSEGRCYLILRPGARKRLFVKTHWQAAGYESAKLRPMFEAIVATIEVEPQRTTAEIDVLRQKNQARMLDVAARIRRLQAAKKKAVAGGPSPGQSVVHKRRYFTFQTPATWKRTVDSFGQINKHDEYVSQESKYEGFGSLAAAHIAIRNIKAKGTVHKQAKKLFKGSLKKRFGSVPKKGTIRHETWPNGMEVSSYDFEYRFSGTLTYIGRCYFMGRPGKAVRLLVVAMQDPKEKDSGVSARLDQIVESIRFK